MSNSTASNQVIDKKDHWSSAAYSGAASFVPQLTTKVLQYLDPQPDDRILSIGCGDGVLEAKIAPLCQHITGLDSSAAMIQTAAKTVTAQHANTEFVVADCSRLSLDACESESPDVARAVQPQAYDKVFSNAAMHWVLRDEGIRKPFFADVCKLLKPGGEFVFEMGGFQNVPEVHTGLMALLRWKYNVPMERIRARDPWFYPSEGWARETLEGAGFEVRVVEVVHRPTRLTEKKADGSGGLIGWLRLMCARFLEDLEAKDREGALESLCEVLEPVVTKVEDGSQWLSYVRLRAVARRRA